MSNRHYDAQWRACMAELAEVLAAECPPAPATPPNAAQAPAAPAAVTADARRTFAHYRALYVRLTGLARRLAGVVAGLAHPQKAIDARAAHALVLARAAQAFHVLVRWHPAPPGRGDAPAPCEYVDLGEELLARQLPEEAVDLAGALLPPPCDDDAAAVRRAWLQREEAAPAPLRVLAAHSAACEPAPLPPPPPPGAAAVLIQRHARGRQGRAAAAAHRCARLAQERAVLAAVAGGAGGDGASSRHHRPPPRQLSAPLLLLNGGRDIMDSDDAATVIQRVARGRLARSRVAREAAEELVALGMATGSSSSCCCSSQQAAAAAADGQPPRAGGGMRAGSDVAVLQRRADELAASRAAAHASNLQELTAALPALRATLLRDEGPLMRDALRAERMRWFAGLLAGAGAAAEGGPAAAAAVATAAAATTGTGPGSLVPDVTIAAFYSPPVPDAQAAAVAAAAAGGGAKTAAKGGGKAAKAPATATKSGAAAAAPAAPGSGDDGEAADPPPIRACTPWTAAVAEALRVYEARWLHADDGGGGNNPSQAYVTALALEALRPGVREELRLQVDAEMADFIANYRHAREGPPPLHGGGGGGGGGGTRPSTGAGGGRGGKAGAAAAGGGKRPATKQPGAAAAAGPPPPPPPPPPLPGAKLLAVLSTLTTPRAMLQQLGALGLLVAPHPAATLASFLGGENMLGSRHGAADCPTLLRPGPGGGGVGGAWLPPPTNAPPSCAQLRRSVVHYSVLPLLLPPEHQRQLGAFCAAHRLGGGGALPPRSLLLFGPHGAGKSHLALAVANAVGALVVDLSAPAAAPPPPAGESGGGAPPPPPPPPLLLLLHLAFAVAREHALGRVVVLAEDVERLLPAGPAPAAKKAAGASTAAAATAAVASAGGGTGDEDAAPGRTLKRGDLAAYVASLGAAGSAGCSALLIGTTSQPWRADVKAVHACFDRALYVPVPDAGTRLALWTAFAHARLRELLPRLRSRAGAPPAAPPLPDAQRRTPDGAAEAATADEPGTAAVAAAGGGLAAAAAALDAAADAQQRDEARLVGCLLAHMPFTTLAAVSGGYSAGAIKAAVSAALSEARVRRIAALCGGGSGDLLRATPSGAAASRCRRGLRAEVFLGPLSRTPCVHADETARLLDFAAQLQQLQACAGAPAPAAAPRAKQLKKRP